MEVAVHLLVSMEDSANLYCNRLCNNTQVLSSVKNNNIVVVVGQRSDFYGCHSLRSVTDDMLFASKGGLVCNSPLFSVSHSPAIVKENFVAFPPHPPSSFKLPIAIVPQNISRPFPSKITANSPFIFLSFYDI